MCCHPFHIPCGFMGKIITTLWYIHYTGIMIIQATEHPSCGTRFGDNCRTMMPSSGCCMLLYEEPQVMVVLLPISYDLWVHGQGMTGLGYIHYTRIMLIQASEYPSCWARFGDNCKTMMPSSGWCMLLGEEPQAMDVLQSISHILCVHVQVMTGLKHSQHTGIPSI